MWKEILVLIQTILTLTRDQEQSRKEIKELNEKVYSLASAVRSLSDKIDANARTEAAERKVLILELQNQFLRNGQDAVLSKVADPVQDRPNTPRLPPSKD